jgi:type I restriction enzyme S subunit
MARHQESWAAKGLILQRTIVAHMSLIENNASGSTFKEISGSVLKEITLLLPEKGIIEEFIKTIKPVFSQLQILELENAELSALRDWLLPLLMSGEVVVGE